MRRMYKSLLAPAALLLLAVSPLSQGQDDQPRFLSLTPPEGLPIIPLMEGWVANEDGTTTISFGFINRNTDEDVDIPLGENNYIEPAEFDGMQPTHFPSGRSTGVFTVTLPEDQADIDVWWNLQTGESEVLRVPGRRGASAYELDFIRPRPQGSLQPLAAFGDTELSAGLSANISDYGASVAVGETVELVLNASDPADRDPEDPRFGEPLDMNVEFSKHQGPGDVTFERDPNAPEPENPFDPDDPRFEFFTGPQPNRAIVEGGAGSAMVMATFSAPGDYIIRAAVDVHTAPDSSYGDQCCWTNVYQRVTVTE
ncbi:MAG: hypothetical protein OXI17_15085 [Gammaproteobacteria bacterium]|nr:hypothetical protein [Gammaproteobacteria bacterium]MYC60921.1 hypothetical protein [Gammaproteobacteria bacterium]MYE30000.1 hypothetical protein [Gammaproteobacteria bacterium]MYI02205.1 hypothetical protein [Gammaproteobacteria bacterium]